MIVSNSLSIYDGSKSVPVYFCDGVLFVKYLSELFFSFFFLFPVV